MEIQADQKILNAKKYYQNNKDIGFNVGTQNLHFNST